MISVVLDGEAVKSRAEALEAFASCFPDWYGRNLDALWDCLTEYGEPLEIRLVHLQELEASLGPFWRGLRRVLGEAPAENPLVSIITEDG